MVQSKEFKAQVKQLIEMNKVDISKGDISFNFTDNNVIKQVVVDKNNANATDQWASGDCTFSD